MVMQDPHLFHDTIRANLRYARPDATDAELVEACTAARIHDLIASLPDGYDTVVGDRGYRMSGGEKQRLAIARMLLKDPAVVILDEATSHLDSESELAIQHAFADALVGRTSLVIAHRLSTIVAADRILVLERRAHHRERAPRRPPPRRGPLHRPVPHPGRPTGGRRRLTRSRGPRAPPGPGVEREGTCRSAGRSRPGACARRIAVGRPAEPVTTVTAG